MSPNSSIRVQIFGKVHQLRADDDPEHTRRVAELVDSRMSRIADHGGAADSYRVAVLAALEIADELLRSREELAEYLGAVNDESDRLAALLEHMDDAASEESSMEAAAD